MNNILKCKAAIFDLDGTLIDSTWVWLEIYKKFSSSFNLTKNLNVAKVMHMPPTECCTKLKAIYGLKQSVDELKEVFLNIAMQFYSTEVKLKPGVLELLDLLKTDGVLISLATSNFVKISEFILKKHRIFDYFSSFNYSDELGVNKKSAILYLKSAEKMKIMPEYCAVFEDIADPLDDVKKANMIFFGIDDGCQSEDIKLKLKSYSDCFIENYFYFIENDYNNFFK